MSSIQEGFPKLAKYHPFDGQIPFWRASRNRITIPSRTGAYWRGSRGITLKDNDLIVLVASEERNKYNIYSAAYEKHTYFYSVPMIALKNDWLPITCITRWRSKYKNLPLMIVEELEILDSEWIMKNK